MVERAAAGDRMGERGGSVWCRRGDAAWQRDDNHLFPPERTKPSRIAYAWQNLSRQERERADYRWHFL
jgi:hypothetical protein